MLGLILFIALMGFTLGRGKLTWPERFLNDVFGTVQEALYRPVGAAADFFRDLGRLSAVQQENEKLRQMLARYTQDQIRYNLIAQENEQLKESLRFTERQKQLNDYQYLIAQVVAVGSNALDRSIKIDLGSRDGIREKMAVQTVDGLIGLVSRVSEFTSTVSPITTLNAASPDGAAIAATVFGKETESFGIIDSYDEESGTLIMSKIPADDPIAVGDLVVTSGMGGLFPKGIIIGTVKSRQVGDIGLTHTANIEPMADFDHPSQLFVVVAPDPDGP